MLAQLKNALTEMYSSAEKVEVYHNDSYVVIEIHSADTVIGSGDIAAIEQAVVEHLEMAIKDTHWEVRVDGGMLDVRLKIDRL